MTYIHSFLFVGHILFGSLALILFWVPMFTKKGQLNHVKFGRWYSNAMYGVAATGAIMAIIVIAMPLTILTQYANHENAAQIAEAYRYFWTFLLYLALLSYTVTKHGVRVLQVKDERHLLKTFSYLAPIACLFILGFGIIAIGVMRDITLHIVFGILGVFVALGMMRYVLKSKMAARRYILEHVSSMMGSGIGAYTAFVAFGGRTLLENAGAYQIVFWVAPGVIGSIASYVLSKKYGKIFRVEASA